MLTTALNPMYAKRSRWSIRFARVKFAFAVVPSTTFSHPRWPCKSTFAGMTVLPVRLTRAAPAGTRNSPSRPTPVNRSFWTMNKCGVLDGRAAVADDQPRSFEHGHVWRLGRLASNR